MGTDSEQSDKKRRQWAVYSDRQVDKIDQIYKENLTCQLVRQAIVLAVRDAGFSGGDLLDVGCGTGEVAIAMHDEGYNVTGLDISPAMLKRFEHLKGDRDIKLLSGDVFDLPGEEIFDVATCRYVFSHYDNFSSFLRHIAKHVKSNGVIVFDSFTSDPLKHNAAKVGITKGPFGRRVYSNLAHFSSVELSAACDALGLRVERRFPAAFFHRNPWFAFSYPAIEEYDAELEVHLNDPGVMKFMNWFHARIAPTMDSFLAGNIVNVLRKL
jgi:2-polyprenyl-3-methyl-5-hydroxy-6-metoxy-1,4-benzoquinol methylase